MEMNDEIDGKREFFRVDDVFPVLIRKCADGRAARSKLVSLKSSPFEAEPSEASLSPRAWNMLLAINAKLDFILEKMYLESEGLNHAAGMPVCISASGLKLKSSEVYLTGDIVEIKMALPVYPPVVIVAMCEVVRCASLADGCCEAAFRFINMDDEIRDEIIQYTFKRQREMNRKE